MNAGRDVERQISAWLTDEATDRSRDRVLAAVHQAVERMPQRRFGAGWRVNSIRVAAFETAGERGSARAWLASVTRLPDRGGTRGD